ncbi:hypothetical protein Ancab_012034 [Ancistrocladus abbreviatus]
MQVSSASSSFSCSTHLSSSYPLLDSYRTTTPLSFSPMCTMSSVLKSQTMILAAAMAVSGTVILLSLCRQKISTSFTQNQNAHSSKQPPLRSCLSSDGKRKDKKKKRVQFAEDVKETSSETEAFKKQGRKAMKMRKSCREQIKGIRGMPPNRIALYNGILRDRLHRIECSY